MNASTASLQESDSIRWGYQGRSPWLVRLREITFPPLLWSLGFVVFGTFAFWSEKRMEAIGEHPPRFSAFWYSLELFLPVVDLGVAKSWRPSQQSFPLLAYARIHQLAGWILNPVALAAITGAFK